MGRLEKAKAEMEATEQPEEAKEAVPQLKKEGASPEDVRCLPFEDSNLSVSSTRIESPCATELEAQEEPEAAEEIAPQAKKEGTSPEDVRCLPLGDSNLSLDITQIESPCAAELEARDDSILSLDSTQIESSCAAEMEAKEDAILSLDSTQIESPCAAEMEAKEQSEAAKEAVPQLKKQDTSPEDVRIMLRRSLQEVMELAATGHGVPDSMEPVPEGQHAQVVLQGMADDGVQMTPQPHEKYPGFEPATEVVSLNECSAKSSAPEDQLKISELDERRSMAATSAAEGGYGFPHKAVLTGCAVVAIAVLAFYTTTRSS